MNKLKLPDFSLEDLNICPLESATTIPSDWCTLEEYFEFEQKIIFSKTWQYVGHTSQLENKGDFFLANVADNSVIIIKSQDDTYSAFYNVCRHRAGPLATKDSNCKVFKCRYHGWTYNHQGKLIGTPEFDGVKNFEKADFGLIPVNIDIWENMIFINLDKNPIPLNNYFSGITERILPIDLKSKKLHCKIEYNLNCNWKVYVDNYLEGYHLHHVHPSLSTLLDYQQYTTEIFKYYSLQYSPFKPGDNLYQESEGQAYYYFVFPNFMLNILPGRLQTNLVIPVAHNKTKVLFDYYYDNPESEEVMKVIEEDLKYSDIIQLEDIEICEAVQRGLKSNAYQKGRLSVKRETGVHHFQNLIRNFYSEAYNSETKLLKLP